jgi:acetyl/propionyl-CoA carboxylase alpha subunit
MVRGTLEVEEDVAREKLVLDPKQLLGVLLQRTEQTEAVRSHLACATRTTHTAHTNDTTRDARTDNHYRSIPLEVCAARVVHVVVVQERECSLDAR